MISDSLIRFLGANPVVYRPIARAQSRILQRGTLLERGGRRGLSRGLTPFQIRCVMATGFSFIFIPWITASHGSLIGVAVTLTAGAGLLLMDLLFDSFNALADPDEYQVIAAHPHDAWSVLLAKLVVLGRGTAAMAACVYTIPAIATAFVFGTVLAGIAYFAAAGALAVAVAAAGMLASALIAAWGGKAALRRVLPFAQLFYLVMALGVFTGRGLARLTAATSLESLGWLLWVLPPVWFLAPVEVAVGQAGPSTLARGAMALGSFFVLLPVCARWIQTRFDERILEPMTARARKSRKPGRAAMLKNTRVPTGWGGSGRMLGLRVFLRILLAHLRGDAAVRGAVMSAFIMPVFMMASSMASSYQERSWPTAIMVVTGLWFAIVLMSGVFQMSSRPSALWFVLISHSGRRSFSGALVWIVRLVLVVPILLGVTIYMALVGDGPMWVRALFVILLALLTDTLLVTGRGLAPAVPFSLPLKRGQRIQWRSLAGMMTMFVALGGVLSSFAFLAKWRPLGVIIPIVCAIAMRTGFGFWAGRRVVRAAREAEAV